MPDLTKELKVEKLTHESWEAEKQFRLNRVANRRPANNPEKSLFFQMSWCNTNTDHLGNILRMVRDLKVTETPDHRTICRELKRSPHQHLNKPYQTLKNRGPSSSCLEGTLLCISHKQ